MTVIRQAFCLLVVCVLLTGCASDYLVIYTDYLSHENLASYYVGTPDPRLNHPPIGQRLILSWSVPKRYEDLRLEMTIRFRNREEKKESLYLNRHSGTYIYSIVNEDFFEKKGILTYKADLYSKDEIIEEWRHQLWTELLIFK